MKRVLIISPHFPPVNTPDLHRVRMSLPYYKQYGWEPVVICVDPEYIAGYTDVILEATLPDDLEVHKVKAWPLTWTRKIGIGSLSIRSFFFFLKKVNQLLSEQTFDLIFFSTTAFHVCALGPYWKKRFRIPFVIDLQDPWRNDYYLDKPKEQRPPKFWFAYNLDKYLERITIPIVDGLMTVSDGYLNMMLKRYPNIKDIPMQVIPFGSSPLDFEVVESNQVAHAPILSKYKDKIKVVYVGAATPFFIPLIRAFFEAFKASISDYKAYHFFFIGTSYSKESNRTSIADLAKEIGLSEVVTEIPERIPYFSALATLMAADVLFIPGSLDINYNASKVYNNILSKRPIFSIFHQDSLVKNIIDYTRSGIVVSISGQESVDELKVRILEKMPEFAVLHLVRPELNLEVIRPFFANEKTREQIDLFNQILTQVSTLDKE